MNVTFHVHIWNQNEKCIKMDTYKPMFGPVVLEIACVFNEQYIFFPFNFSVNTALTLLVTLK